MGVVAGAYRFCRQQLCRSTYQKCLFQWNYLLILEKKRTFAALNHKSEKT